VQWQEGKPPAPKKSAYELKEEKRKAELEEAKRKLAAEEAAVQAKLQEMESSMKTVEEKFIDVFGSESVVQYKTKFASCPEVKSLMAQIKAAISATVRERKRKEEKKSVPPASSEFERFPHFCVVVV
jgi:hypothetical protein